jgi:multicomponent Na+:H+ antiporter subunit E
MQATRGFSRTNKKLTTSAGSNPRQQFSVSLLTKNESSGVPPRDTLSSAVRPIVTMNIARTNSEEKKHLAAFWLSMMLVWILLNASLAWEVLVVGALVATLLVLVFPTHGFLFAGTRFSPETPGIVLKYLSLFAHELVKSNLDVARRMVSPNLRINPGIVEVKTKLKHPTYRLILANSITLTPGTLTVDMIGDSLFIHWIDVTGKDVESATREISSKFEDYLMQLSED